MKRLILLSAILALIISPALASATVTKRGRAVSKVTSRASTSNSISISSNLETQRLFSALTSSTGEAATEAEIEGDEPTSLTTRSFGAGTGIASGRNRGRVNGRWLPEIRGTSESGQEVDSESTVSIE